MAAYTRKRRISCRILAFPFEKSEFSSAFFSVSSPTASPIASGRKPSSDCFSVRQSPFFPEIGGIFRLISPRPALQGDEDRRLFQGEQFEHRIASRAAHDEIGGGIGVRHILFVFPLYIAGDVALHEISPAAEVQDVVFPREVDGAGAEGVVEGAAAASAPEHEQHFLLSRKAVFCDSRFPAPPKQLFAEGGAAVFSVFETLCRLGKRGQDIAAFFRHQSVGEPGGQIAFVREAGDFQLLCGEDDGQGDIAALGKYDVGAEGGKPLCRPFFRPQESGGDFQVGRGESAHEFGTGDLKIGDLLRGDERLFHAVRADVTDVRLPL